MMVLALKPAFNPIYQVHFFSEEGCVFFLNEYPLPSIFITDERLFSFLSLLNGSKNMEELAQALAPRFSVNQVQDVVVQLYKKKLVVFH